jgi:hypothetical protein
VTQQRRPLIGMGAVLARPEQDMSAPGPQELLASPLVLFYVEFFLRYLPVAGFEPQCFLISAS